MPYRSKLSSITSDFEDDFCRETVQDGVIVTTNH